MLYALVLIAEVAGDAKKDDGIGGLFNTPFVPLIAIVVVFYFLIILPGRKEKQQRQTMMSALKRNDRVITNGGIIGTVLNIKEGGEEVTIRSEDTKLLILKSSIARILSEPDKEPSTQIKPAS